MLATVARTPFSLPSGNFYGGKKKKKTSSPSVLLLFLFPFPEFLNKGNNILYSFHNLIICNK